MTDDKFFECLRDDARPLRYEGDDFLTTRIAARVRERIAQPQTVSQLLVAWMRPLAASVAALLLTVTLGLTWTQRHQDPADTLTSNPTEIAMAGETFGVD